MGLFRSFDTCSGELCARCTDCSTRLKPARQDLTSSRESCSSSSVDELKVQHQTSIRAAGFDRMITTIVIALFIQTVCVLGLLLYVRQKWVASAGFIFVVTAWIYHAGSEILNNVFPGRNVYRMLVTSDQVG